METLRIKTKIDDNEFDSEGPVETVQAQFAAFLQAISGMARQKSETKTPSTMQTNDNNNTPDHLPHIPIEKIMHVSGRIVSLTALPMSATDAALLIMLGQKDLRNNIAVTGQEIGDGLAQSGRDVPRVDRIMEQALNEQFVLKTGVKRGTRYRLTNVGLSKALALAREIIESLP